MESTFYGTLIPYEPSAGELEWGGHYLMNEERMCRPRTNRPAGCPFCVRSGTPFLFHGQPFVRKANDFPIVRGHELVFPAGHRSRPDAIDFQLLVELAAAPGNAVYFNSRGGGQTIDHVHLHILPATTIPLPRVSDGPDVLYLASGMARLVRSQGMPYYALAILAPGPAAVEALVFLHARFREFSRSYNILAFSNPDRADCGNLTLLVVPRAQEYCPSVATSLAGFELLTGIIVPDAVPEYLLTREHRDEAFRHATLDPAMAARLERRLLIRAEGLDAARRMDRILQKAEDLRETDLVEVTREVGPEDLIKAQLFLREVAPPRIDNYRLHAHLLLTAEFAGRIAKPLGLNPYRFQTAGLLHDLGRFVTHRYHRTELVGDCLLRRMGVRQDIRATLLPPEASCRPGQYRTFADIPLEQRVTVIADICGKRGDDGTIRSFAEVLRHHLDSRGSADHYAAYIDSPSLWPSEEAGLSVLSPDFAEHWAAIYLGIKDWLCDEYHLDLDCLREELSTEEIRCRPDTIIFDVGGVLIDNPDTQFQQELRQLCRGDADRINSFLCQVLLLQIGQVSEQVFQDRVAPLIGFPGREDYLGFWARHLNATVRPAVYRLVERLKQGGFRVCLLSDTIPPHQRILEGAGVYDGHDGVVLSPEIGCAKAQGGTAPYWIAALRQGKRPQACLLIDDNPGYLERAAALGMHTLQFQSPEQLEQDLVRLGLLGKA